MLDTGQTQVDEKFEWLQDSRDVRQYVLPDVGTALLGPEEPCSDRLHLLILVTSAPGNTERRQAVRDTWGYAAPIPITKLLFFMGHDGDGWPPQTTVRETGTLCQLKTHADFSPFNLLKPNGTYTYHFSNIQ